MFGAALGVWRSSQDLIVIFKKAFQIVLVFGLLLAGYAGYVRAFAFVAGWFRPEPWPYVVEKSERIPSATEKEAVELARKEFGPNHWSIKAPWKYYNSERQYWMFALNYTRVNQGKRFTFKPFAIIWRSRDGRTIKTVVGDEAVVDFDQPIDIIKPGTKAGHVVFAQLSNNVKVHDDRGTPEDPSDDLTIGPLTYLDFDEPNLQVRTESVVVLKDRDMQATGVGMIMDLRPHPGSSRAGFNGAKTVRLKRNVHIYAKNVGRSGILPGSAKDGAPSEPVPIDLTCAGEMRIELPEPSPPTQPGQPPPPAKPTLAWFKRNVCVRRGTEKVDQLDCDELYLILFPAPKTQPGQPPSGQEAQLAAKQNEPPPATTSPSAPPPNDGPLTELTLRRAEATGHAVWLQSEAQAAQILGSQLIYEKNLPEAPDKTYIQGSPATPLWIVKTEYETLGPNTGKVKYIDTIRTQDLTLFDSGQGTGKSTVWARGPGKLETRTTKTAPVSRMATWQLEAVMRTEGQGDESRRTITLVGQPKVADVTSGTLTADRSIVAWLRPKDPAATATATTEASASPAATSSDTMRIERVEALQNVRLVKASDEMFARDRLNAIFDVPPPATTPAAPAAGAAQPAPASSAQPAPEPATQTPEPEKATRPPLHVEADRIWARILQPPGEKAQGEVQEARLRGNVNFHQDPAPDKTQGTDVVGYGVDLYPQGQGRYLFQVESSADQMAEVRNDEFDVKAAWTLALNQATDYAWVDGPGTLTQMVHQGLLNDGGLEEDGSAPTAQPVADDRERAAAAPKRKEPAKPKVPLVITWRSRMEFRGSTDDEQGGKVAKADFFTDVVAYTDDAQIFSQRLEAFMDRPVAFTKPKNAPRTPENEPKAQIAFVRATADLPYRVNAINTKLDPVTGRVIEKQRVLGQKLLYDKASGEYEVPGAGMVWLYAQRGEGAGNPLQRPGNRAPQTAGGTTSRTAGSGPARVSVATTGANSGTPVRQGQNPAQADAGSKTGPLELTRIRFAKGMKGRFGSGKDTATASPREAEFTHNVEVLHGPVKDERQDLDPDRPPLEYVYLTSQNLLVVSEPPPPGSNTPSHDYLNAYNQASASTRDKEHVESTIQADQITYDSAKKLFYYYGYNGRQVAFQQSAGPGQPTSNGSAESGFYNYETGQSGLNAPQNFRLFDLPKNGTRASDAKEPKDEKPKKPVRRNPRMPGRSDKERRGFNGR